MNYQLGTYGGIVYYLNVPNPYSVTARTPGSGDLRQWIAFRWGESRGVAPISNFFAPIDGGGG